MQGKNRSRRNAPWSRPLADLVGTAIDPILERQGFGQSDILLHWNEIVGARLAAASEPVKLRWPPRRANRTAADPATLVIRVESGFALEMQHSIDILVERINAHLGWKCVGRVLLKQGPLLRRATTVRRPAPPSPQACAAAEAHVAGLGTPQLRQALARLGARVLEQTSARKSI